MILEDIHKPEMLEVRTVDLTGPALRYVMVLALGGGFVAEDAPLEGRTYQRIRIPGMDFGSVWFEGVHPSWRGLHGGGHRENGQNRTLSARPVRLRP